MSQFDSIPHSKVVTAPLTLQTWSTLDFGRHAGVVCTAGGGGLAAGNLAFLIVFEAGYVSGFFTLPDPKFKFLDSHELPHDPPEAALAGSLLQC